MKKNKGRIPENIVELLRSQPEDLRSFLLRCCPTIPDEDIPRRYDVIGCLIFGFGFFIMLLILIPICLLERKPNEKEKEHSTQKFLSNISPAQERQLAIAKVLGE